MEPIDIPTLFHDVTPVPQDDGADSVCSINYSEEYILAMDYFRAILEKDERSERALKLTTKCLVLNPANYTTWHFRRRCLASISEGTHAFEPELVRADLVLAEKLGGGNPKNYQIWYHRRTLLEPFLSDKETKSDAAREELAYVSSVLAEDAKNYHAWSHRQWIVQLVSSPELWEEEKHYVHSLILQDHRNNSAWNHRWFVAHKGEDALTSQEYKIEAEYALRVAEMDPYNESPWRYLIGVLKEQIKCSRDSTENVIEENEQKIVQVREELGKNTVDPYECSNLTSAHIDLLEIKSDCDSLLRAADLANGLATKYDIIRTKYWLRREEKFRSSMKQFS